MQKEAKFDYKIFFISTLILLALVGVVYSGLGPVFTTHVTGNATTIGIVNLTSGNFTFTVTISNSDVASNVSNVTLYRATPGGNWTEIGHNKTHNQTTYTIAVNFTNDNALNGTYELNATLYNSTTGTYSNKTVGRVYIDTLRPVITLANTTSTNTTSSAINLQFTATDYNISSCQLWFGLDGAWTAKVSNTTVNAGTITVPYDNSSVADGNYFFAANCTDTLGNMNFSSSNTSFTVDTMNPNVTLTSPDDQGVNTSSTISFTYTGNDINIDTCSVFGNFSGSWAQNVTNATVSDGITINHSTSITEGAYIWNVRCNDTAGNSAYNSTNRTLYVNPTAPTLNLTVGFNHYNSSRANVPITFGIRDTFPGINNGSFKINVTSADGTNLSTFSFPDNITCSPTTFASNTSTGITCNFTTRPFPDGSYFLNMSVEDGFDQINNSNTTFLVDTMDPNVTLTMPPDGIWNTSSAITFNYTAYDTNIHTCAIFGNFTGSWAQNVTNTTITTGATDIQVVTVQDGNFIWNVRCNDTSGRAAYNSTNRTIKIDTQAPTLSFTPTVGFNSTKSNVAVTFTAKDFGVGIKNTTIMVNVSNGSVKHFYSFPSNGSNMTCTPASIITNYTAGALVCNLTTPTLPDGFFNVSFSVEDGFGQINTNKSNFTIDTLIPNFAANITSVVDTGNAGNLNVSWGSVGGGYTYGVFRKSTNYSITNLSVTNALLESDRLRNVSERLYFIDNTTAHGTTYWYGVTAIDPSGNENISIVNMTLGTFQSHNGTANDQVIPLNPISVVATNTTTTTTINWSRVINDISGNADFTGLKYLIWYKPTTLDLSAAKINATNANMSFIENITGPANTTTWEVPTNCTTACRYYFAVTTVDDGQNYNRTVQTLNFWNGTLLYDPAAESGSSSSSSSSTGGGGTVGSSDTIASAAKQWGALEAGVPVEMDITNSLIAVRKIILTSGNAYSNVGLDVASINKPSDLSAVTGEAYQYLDIDATNLPNEGITTATIEFRVPFTWFNDLGTKRADVAIHRYDGGWSELATVEFDSDSSYAYYRANTPGFSYFAIAAPSATSTDTTGDTEDTAEEDEVVEDTTTEEESGEEEIIVTEKSKAWIWWTIIILLIIIGAGVYFFISSKKE